MSMSGRLALLSILFILLVEIVSLVPALSYFRINQLQARIDDASLVAEALLSTPEASIDPTQSDALLASAGVLDIALIHPDRRERLLIPTVSFEVTDVVDLTNLGLWKAFYSGPICAVFPRDGVIRVIGQPKSTKFKIETSLKEASLCQDVRATGLNILAISLLISLVAGAILYFIVNQLFVRPILFLTRSITRFKGDRNAHLQLIQARSRIKEIHAAQASLRDMQERILKSMGQKERLANLGESVAKIQHDLRNMLSTAQMVTDSLENSQDPLVRRSAPRLVRAIDRAIELSSQTLEYGRVGERPAKKTLFALCPMLNELVEDELALAKEQKLRIDISCGPAEIAFGDVSFTRRIVQNLVRNARQALETHGDGVIQLIAKEKNQRMVIKVIDNGAGFSEQAIEGLFQPFKGSSRIGGTGLGLAISKELSQLQNGDLDLTRTDASGSQFTLILPKNQ